MTVNSDHDEVVQKRLRALEHMVLRQAEHIRKLEDQQSLMSGKQAANDVRYESIRFSAATVARIFRHIRDDENDAINWGALLLAAAALEGLPPASSSADNFRKVST